MISSINSRNAVNNMSSTRASTRTNSKVAEEADESISEKMAEAHNQKQSSTSFQIKPGASKISPGSNAAGSTIDVHI